MPSSDSVRVGSVDPALTRPTLLGIESTFGAGLVAQPVRDAIHGLELGFKGLLRTNLVTRSAPMGAVNADVVVATFYNFNPALAESLFPQVWAKASPERILQVQREAFSPVLSSALAPLDPDELRELAELARLAAEAAGRYIEGRPLLAGLVAQPWPREDHLAIWHAAKILREHRGDGHLATLIVEGLRGIEALAVHAAFDSNLPEDLLRDSRRWDEASWQNALADLRRRGWLTDDERPTLTEHGRQRRQWIEDRTDELAAPAYEPLGAEGMARMRELGDKVGAALRQAGLSLGVRPRHARADQST